MNKSLFLLLLLTFSFTAFGQEKKSETNNKATPAEYIDISFEDQYDVVTYSVEARRREQGGRYGFHNGNEWIIPPIYDLIPDRLSKFMVVKRNMKYGVINSKSQEVVPVEFDYIKFTFKEKGSNKKSGYYEVRKGNRHGLLSNNGKFTISVEYNHFYRDDDLNYSVGSKETGYGVLSQEGREIIPVVYDNPVQRISANRYKVKKNNLIGIIDSNSKVLIPFKYEEISRLDTFTIYKRNGKRGFMDRDYEEITQPIYDMIHFLWYSRNFPVTKEGKRGVLNSKLQTIIPTEYDEVEPFHERYYYACKKKKGIDYCGIFDYLGKTVLPEKYVIPLQGPGDLFFTRKANDKKENLYSIYNETGRKISSEIFADVKNIVKDYAAVRLSKNGKFALINDKGKVLTSYIYDKIKKEKIRQPNSKYKLIAKRGEFEGTLNFDGTEKDDFQSKVSESKGELSQEQKKINKIAGEWYGLQKIYESEFLVRIKIRNDKTGTRTVYNLNKECTVKQNFSIKPHKHNTSVLFLNLDSIDVTQKCQFIPFTSNNHSVLRNKIVLTGSPEKVVLQNYTRKENLDIGADNYESLRQIRKARAIADSLQSKFKYRKGGIRYPQFNVLPVSKVVKIGGDDKKYFGKIEIQDGSYVFVPEQWVDDYNLPLYGILRDVRYRDKNGKIKTGNLDILRNMSQENLYYFRELE